MRTSFLPRSTVYLQYGQTSCCARAALLQISPGTGLRQTQRRTLTPPTQTQRQATATGLRTTTAPRAPPQPARYTPRAHTTALASDVSKVMVAANDSTAAAISRNERMLASEWFG